MTCQYALPKQRNTQKTAQLRGFLCINITVLSFVPFIYPVRISGKAGVDKGATPLPSPCFRKANRPGNQPVQNRSGFQVE